jgi:O-antigen/teichoic acid export membrane protein
MKIYWRHVSTVFAGALFAQLIPIAGSLVITRIFAPDAFGEFATWLAYISFAAVIATLRLETTLPILEDGKARGEAVCIIMRTVFVVTAFLVAIFLVADYLFRTDKFLPGGSYALLSMPMAIIFAALNNTWQTWAASDGEYSKLNFMRITQAISIVIFQIGAGLKSPSALGLMLGYVFAACVSFFVAVALMPRSSGFSRVGINEFRAYVSRYRKFPTYALPADAINSVVAHLPLLVVFNRFGGEAAGYLALTMRVLGAPIGLIGKAVLDVFKRQAVQSIKQIGNCRDLYIATFFALGGASIIMVLVTYFFAEDIFRLAFGTDWEQSGRMAVWLLPMFAIGLIASPLSYMSYLVEKPNVDLMWQLILMLVVMGTLFWGASYKATLISYAIGYALMYIFYLLMSYRFSCGR